MILQLLKQAFLFARNAISDFFSDDMALMTPEFRRILSNRADFEAYKVASNKIRTGSLRASFTLQNGQTITLINYGNKE